MNSSICVVNRKPTTYFRIVLSIVTIAPLWLLLATANPSQAQTTPSPSDWTEFLRDNMQRWNPYETVLGVGNVGKLGLKWSSPYSLASDSPAVANGVIYFGSGDSNVYALDASTGAKLWSFGPGGQFVEPWSPPAVANGMVYIGSSNGNVYALNASTGAKLWNYTTGFSVMAAPVVANGVVYAGSQDGNLYALNSTTGALVWSYTTGQIVQGPAVLNGVVYIGAGSPGSGGPVYALNATTGAKLWSYDTGDSMVFSTAVANGVVYVGTLNMPTDSGTLYALNATTGAKLWTYTTGPVQSAPAIANGIVYVSSLAGGSATPVAQMSALNASTGALVWKYAPLYLYGEGSPAVANGVVYVSRHAFNASTGALLWQSNGSSSPVVVNGTLYLGVGNQISAFAVGGATADLFLRINPTPTTVHQGDLLTYAFPVWNLGPDNAAHEVLTTQVPAGTTFDSIRISGTPGLGTCTTPTYGGTGQIVCNENSAMAPNTTWTVRLTVKVTAAAGTVITENAATMADTPDPNLANNMATVSTTVAAADADLYLRVSAAPTPYTSGQLLTYTFPVWNLGPGNAVHEVLTTQVPSPFVFDYIRISGTPGLGTCTTPPYGGTGAIVCHENSSMAPNTTWTVRLTVMLPPDLELIRGDTITESATVTADTPDPNLANNTATVTTPVQ